MKTIRTYLGALALFFSLSSVLLAQGRDPDQFTLDQAIQEALEQNRDLSAVRKNREIAEGISVRSRTYPFNPEIDFGITTDRWTKNENENSRSIGLSQKIEIAGQRGLRIQSATLEQDRVDLEVQNAERLLLAEVQALFNQLLHLERRIAFSDEVINLNRQLVKTTEDRFDVGEAPGLDVSLAQVELNRTINERTGLEREMAVLRARLNRLMGRPLEANLKLVGSIAFHPTSPDLEALLQLARKNRPDLISLQTELKQADIETTLQKRQRISNLRLSTFVKKSRGTIGDAAGATLSDQDTLIGFGLSFSLPIFNQRKGEIIEARGIAHRTEQEKGALALQIEEEVRQAFSRLSLTQKVLTLFEKGILKQSRENLDLIRAAYEVGEVGITTVIQEQERFIRTNISYFDSLFDFHVALIDLERSVGKRIMEGMM
ncbi:MAG: TolC family protein [Candidatus Manganitrophaceae bacterium]